MNELTGLTELTELTELNEMTELNGRTGLTGLDELTGLTELTELRCRVSHRIAMSCLAIRQFDWLHRRRTCAVESNHANATIEYNHAPIT